MQVDTRPRLIRPKGTRWTQKNNEKYAKLEQSGLYNMTPEKPPEFDMTTRSRRRMRIPTEEEERDFKERRANPDAPKFQPKCRCDEVEEEYQSLLRGAEKPYKRLECLVHRKKVKRLPAKKKHPIPDRMAQLMATARVVTPGPDRIITVDPDACIELDMYLGRMRAAGFELERNAKGLAYLVDLKDPYGVLEQEKNGEMYVTKRLTSSFQLKIAHNASISAGTKKRAAPTSGANKKTKKTKKA